MAVMEDTMLIPSEFERLGSCFLQDDYDWGIENLPEWSKKAIELSHLPPSGIQTLKEFLDRTLESGDDDYVDTVLWSMGASFAMRGGGGARTFLTTVRQLLDTVKVKSLAT